MSVEPGGLSCPRCDAAVPADARFCMSCGQSLDADAGAGALQARISAAAPAPLVEKMRAAKLTGERKPVTALFADVVGSTTLAEQMDPEDWTQIINEAFDLMSQAVFRYEGTIAQLQGDALLAFFGAPVAHEDDPYRAVRAALDMVEQVREFARQLKAAHGIEFNIRAGINSGPVIVGNVGSDLRYEYTALGDAVNVAARVQSAAVPGSVLVTAQTQRFVANAFDFEALGEVELKGKAEPVQLLRVLGLKEAPGRSRGLQGIGLDSPMVGRTIELDRLRTLFDAVQAGRGRVCFLVGEPGIGKSRLLAELGRSLPAATWVEGRCVSYGRNLPYHLLLDIVRGLLGLTLSGSAADARQAFDERLRELLGDEASDVAPFLAHLLSLPLSAEEADRARIDPDAMQDRYGAATVRLVRAVAQRAPAVIVCEDIHWADPASIKVLRTVMPLIAELRVLFVAALRGERDSEGWRLIQVAEEVFGDALAVIRLEPLSEADSRQLVSNLLVIESLPDEVRDVILARAEGNPFFVEEVVRMLIERDLIRRDDGRWLATAQVTTVDIPDTLHSLLLARIDQLPAAAKRSLRVAAVIGRQFPVRVLETVLQQTPEVTTQ